MPKISERQEIPGYARRWCCQVRSGGGSGSPSISSHHLIDTGADGREVLALPQQRHHRVLDDAIGRRIGQHAFQAVAVLDAQRVIVLGQDQQRAVIDLLAPELPGVDDADRILLDLLGLRGRHQQHRDLRALARLEVRQLLLELGLLRGSQRSGQIGDARLELRDRLQRLRSGDAERGAQRSAITSAIAASSSACDPTIRRRAAAAPTRAPYCAVRPRGLERSDGAAALPKSTVGGRAISASFCTVKFGFTGYLNIIAVRLVGN